VFLSHSHADAAVVERIGVRLEDEAELRVWLDRWVLIPGTEWQQHMARGLDQAQTCAVCIGNKAAEGWFREEIGRALNRRTRDQNFRVIPVILPGGNRALVDDFLELRTWVDFSNGIEDGPPFHQLLSGIKGIPPGRYKDTSLIPNATLSAIRDGLARIRDFREQRLIDDDIALEFQRRLLDQLLTPGGPTNA